jgi:hypothetical protein
MILRVFIDLYFTLMLMRIIVMMILIGVTDLKQLAFNLLLKAWVEAHRSKHYCE